MSSLQQQPHHPRLVEDDDIDDESLLLDALASASTREKRDILVLSGDEDDVGVPACRYVLGVSSPVLLRILYKTHKKCTSLLLQQYRLLQVKALVEFCHSNDVQQFMSDIHLSCEDDDRGSIDTEEENIDDNESIREVVHLCHLARRFEVEGLEERACELTALVLEQRLHLACSLYDEALFLLGGSNSGLPPPVDGVCILTMALDAIRTNPAKCLLEKSDEEELVPGVAHLSADALQTLLRDNQVSCDEIVLFQAISTWSHTARLDEENEQQQGSSAFKKCKCGDASNSSRQRQVAKSFVSQYINLECMTPSELLGEVSSSGLVKQYEINSALQDKLMTQDAAVSTSKEPWFASSATSRDDTTEDMNASGHSGSSTYQDGFSVPSMDDEPGKAVLLQRESSSQEDKKPSARRGSRRTRLLSSALCIVPASKPHKKLTDNDDSKKKSGTAHGRSMAASAAAATGTTASTSSTGGSTSPFMDTWREGSIFTTESPQNNSQAGSSTLLHAAQSSIVSSGGVTFVAAPVVEPAPSSYRISSSSSSEDSQDDDEEENRRYIPQSFTQDSRSSLRNEGSLMDDYSSGCSSSEASSSLVGNNIPLDGVLLPSLLETATAKQTPPPQVGLFLPGHQTTSTSTRKKATSSSPKTSERKSKQQRHHAKAAALVAYPNSPCKGSYSNTTGNGGCHPYDNLNLF